MSGRQDSLDDGRVAWYLEELKASWHVTVSNEKRQKKKQRMRTWVVQVDHPWGNESYTFTRTKLVTALRDAYNKLPQRPRFFIATPFDAEGARNPA